MKPRITISVNPDGDYLEIYLNPEGRTVFVEALQRLSKGNEHFHMGPEDEIFEVDLAPRPYHSNDKVIRYAKVLFRPDEWDRQYYPHVFGPDSEESN